jgi:hypothetical protein
MADFTALKAEVERNRSVTESAVTLLNGVAAELIDARNDPEEITAIANTLRANSDQLAAAIAANTPQQPPTP